MVKSLESLNNIFNVSHDSTTSNVSKKSKSGKIMYSNDMVMFMKKLKNAKSLENINALSLALEDDINKINYSIESLYARESVVTEVRNRMASYSTEAANYCLKYLRSEEEEAAGEAKSEGAAKKKGFFKKLVQYLRIMFKKFMAWLASVIKWIKEVFSKVWKKLKDLVQKAKNRKQPEEVKISEAAAAMGQAWGNAGSAAPAEDSSASDDSSATDKPAKAPKSNSTAYTGRVVTLKPGELYISKVKSKALKPFTSKFLNNPEGALLGGNGAQFKKKVTNEDIGLPQFKTEYQNFLNSDIYAKTNVDAHTPQECLNIKSDIITAEHVDKLAEMAKKLEKNVHESMAEVNKHVDNVCAEMEKELLRAEENPHFSTGGGKEYIDKKYKGYIAKQQYMATEQKKVVTAFMALCSAIKG